jgi:hypothetical protein
MASTI